MKIANEGQEISALANLLASVIAAPARTTNWSLDAWAKWAVIATHVLDASAHERERWRAWAEDPDSERPPGIVVIEIQLEAVFAFGKGELQT